MTMSDVPLLPGEAAGFPSASTEKRRREFMTGRGCAHRALAALGIRNVPVPRGERGEPCWPVGIVGSITHCSGYSAAAVAPQTFATTVGIDAETHAPLAAEVAEYVCTDAERRWIQSLGAHEGVHWESVIFSAKESVYKAWFPVARCWLGFADVELELDAAAGRFTAAINSSIWRPDPFKGSVAGRFAIFGDRVLTSLALCP